MNTWTFANLWNRSIERREQIPLEKRDHLWASELGGPMIDIYLKLKGVPYTNPPNLRSLRKFEAGNLWEAIVGHVLSRSGILISKQDRVEFQYDGLLKVTGKLDYMAGGVIDWEKAKKYAEEEVSWLPESIKRGTFAIIEGLQAQFGSLELRKIVLEIKSCSTYMYDVYEATGRASPQHELQAYHYLRSTGMEEAHIVYICKDDCRMLEFGVYLGTEELERRYKDFVEQMTLYMAKDVEPPKEKMLVTNDSGKVSTNWKVEYSPYLTRLYGFNEPMEYRDKFTPIASRFNRVIARVKEGKTLTEDNQRAIAEMKDFGLTLTIK